MCDDETYRRFEDGELFVDWEAEEFVTLDELRGITKKTIDHEDRFHRLYPTANEIDAMEYWELIEVLEDWYQMYGAENRNSGIHREMLLPSGERVHALSEYYSD